MAMGRAAPGSERTERLKGPMAFFGDVQGNLPALDAVLANTANEGVHAYFCVGDSFLHGAQPREVWQRLVDLQVRCVRGPADLALATVDPSGLRRADPDARSAIEHLKHTREALGELILARLARLPTRIRITLGNGQRVLVTYGSPNDPLEPIAHDLSDDEALACVRDARADVIVCGGALVPFERDVHGVQIVNVGSLGGARTGGVAHYTLIEPAGEGVDVRQSWARYASA